MMREPEGVPEAVDVEEPVPGKVVGARVNGDL
jgi:hypothetical protein